MPVPPLPASCSVEALRSWLAFHECVDHADMARAVRALVEAKVRWAILYAASAYDVDALREDVDSIVACSLRGAP